MKRSTRCFPVLLLGIAFFVPQVRAAAQVHMGFHGTLTEVRRRTAPGVGGRLAVTLRNRTDIVLVMEGVGEYLWPSCEIVDCGAMQFQANLLGRVRLARFGEGYGGFGVVYQDHKVESRQQTYEEGNWGADVLIGSQAGSLGGALPFIEVRYTFLNSISNQFGASLGLRFPLGG